MLNKRDNQVFIHLLFSALVLMLKVENKVVKKRILNDPVTYPEKFSENARSICEGLLCKEVDKRLGFKNDSCDELRAHPFFSEINWRKLNAGQTETRKEPKVPLKSPVCSVGFHHGCTNTHLCMRFKERDWFHLKLGVIGFSADKNPAVEILTQTSGPPQH